MLTLINSNGGLSVFNSVGRTVCSFHKDGYCLVTGVGGRFGSLIVAGLPSGFESARGIITTNGTVTGDVGVRLIDRSVVKRGRSRIVPLISHCSGRSRRTGDVMGGVVTLGDDKITPRSVNVLCHFGGLNRGVRGCLVSHNMSCQHVNGSGKLCRRPSVQSVIVCVRLVGLIQGGRE